MSTVVGLETLEQVIIGGDTAMIRDNDTVIQTGVNKVWSNGEFVLGMVGSVRAVQLVRHRLPRLIFPPGNIEHYIITELTDYIVDAIADTGETEWCLLVGCDNELYQIDNDLAVTRSDSGVRAIGSGGDVALGSLYTTGLWPGASRPPDSLHTAQNRVQTALEAAAALTNQTKGPFTLMTTR